MKEIKDVKAFGGQSYILKIDNLRNFAKIAMDS